MHELRAGDTQIGKELIFTMSRNYWCSGGVRAPTSCANSSCGRPSFIGARKPATGSRLRHRGDHQVSTLLVVLEGALRQGSSCDSSKLPGRRKWWRSRWVWRSLRSLRELLLLLSSGACIDSWRLRCVTRHFKSCRIREKNRMKLSSWS